MAPEIIENWKVLAQRITPQEGSEYKASADVFSGAVVLWECLTCEQPYMDAAGNALRDERGRKLVGVDLTDAIVAGLRPSAGRIPDGEGGYVSERMQALVERGWAADAEARPSAEAMAAVIKEEMDEMRNAVVEVEQTRTVMEQNPVAEAPAVQVVPAVHPVMRPTIREIRCDAKGTMFRLTDFSESLEDQERAERAERGQPPKASAGGTQGVVLV